jgi:thiaminase
MAGSNVKSSFHSSTINGLITIVQFRSLVNSGTPLKLTRFDQQDYLYVRVFTTFTAKIWQSIPEKLSQTRSLMENGYKSLFRERELFHTNAENRKISLPPTTSPAPSPAAEHDSQLSSLKQYFHPSCYKYAEWMISCADDKSISFANLLLFLWGIEKCYFEAFSYVKQAEAYKSREFDEGYRKFVDWWTAAEFGMYIKELEEGFNAVRKNGERWDEKQGRELMRVMLEHEASFWASAFF